MLAQHLFNSRGNWIAFRVGRFVYNTGGQWVGWLPWDDNDVVDRSGNYLGTIFKGGRLYKLFFKPYRGYPGYPGNPGYPAYWGYPGHADFAPIPSGAADVDEPK